jgi:outer membrane protein assembly factor BamA
MLRLLCWVSAWFWCCIQVAVAADAPLPSLAELEAAGARIGNIRLQTQDIFDANDPRESGLFYRLANRLHIQTRPSVIERSLLFKQGDKLSVQRIEETERLLRSNAFLYDVSIKPMAYQDGVVDLEVKTFDTWSLTASANLSREGGANTTGLKFQEKNLLGTGLAVGLASSSNPDRKGTEFELSHRHTLGNWNELSYKKASYDDGTSQVFSFKRPFYALDTRWAAGMVVSNDDRQISAFGNGGALVDRYRLKQNKIDIAGGWSNGLVNGWTRRYSLGLIHQEDQYQLAATFTSPALPTDQRLVMPYLRYELVQDQFEKLKNRNQVGRPEYFATGFAMQLQLGRALTALGSTRNLWDYQGTISDGYVVAGSDLVASATVRGQYGDDKSQQQLLTAAAKYYVTHNEHARLYVGLSHNATNGTDAVDQLQLGGDNGLRGYPSRYQSGQRSSVLTVEERFYSDVFFLRLFRFGGAVFIDTGRAWGGANPNKINPGVLSDVGFGLRIFNVRAAQGNVLHLDFAFPLQRDPSIKSFQVLFKTKASF